MVPTSNPLKRTNSSRLLRRFAREAGFIQFGENVFGAEIAGDFKYGGVLGRGVAGDAGRFRNGGIHGFDAFGAAQMDAGNFHGLNFGGFAAGFGRDLDRRIAGFTEITGGDERVD